jgi:hypothetical protein
MCISKTKEKKTMIKLHQKKRANIKKNEERMVSNTFFLNNETCKEEVQNRMWVKRGVKPKHPERRKERDSEDRAIANTSPVAAD